jgi:hypothetical protein
METLTIRELPHVTTLVFEHEENNVAVLLRLLADYCEASNGCLQGVSYHNDDDGGYRERIVAHVECPWQV